MKSVDYSDLILGIFTVIIGIVGIVKSIAILKYKKVKILPVFDFYLLILRILFGKDHKLYAKAYNQYINGQMKIYAGYYLLTLPIITVLGVSAILNWFR